MYYPAGTLKARLCVRGKELLYELCERQGVPHRRITKLIVATAPAETANSSGCSSSVRPTGWSSRC